MQVPAGAERRGGGLGLLPQVPGGARQAQGDGRDTHQQEAHLLAGPSSHQVKVQSVNWCPRLCESHVVTNKV